jgi:hypothetical protein
LSIEGSPATHVSGDPSLPPRRPPVASQRLRDLAPDILPPVVVTHDRSRVHVTAKLHRVPHAPALIQGLGHRTRVGVLWHNLLSGKALAETSQRSSKPSPAVRIRPAPLAPALPLCYRQYPPGRDRSHQLPSYPGLATPHFSLLAPPAIRGQSASVRQVPTRSVPAVGQGKGKASVEMSLIRPGRGRRLSLEAGGLDHRHDTRPHMRIADESVPQSCRFE